MSLRQVILRQCTRCLVFIIFSRSNRALACCLTSTRPYIAKTVTHTLCSSKLVCTLQVTSAVDTKRQLQPTWYVSDCHVHPAPCHHSFSAFVLLCKLHSVLWTAVHRHNINVNWTSPQSQAALNIQELLLAYLFPVVKAFKVIVSQFSAFVRGIGCAHALRVHQTILTYASIRRIASTVAALPLRSPSRSDSTCMGKCNSRGHDPGTHLLLFKGNLTCLYRQWSQTHWPSGVVVRPWRWCCGRLQRCSSTLFGYPSLATLIQFCSVQQRWPRSFDLCCHRNQLLLLRSRWCDWSGTMTKTEQRNALFISCKWTIGAAIRAASICAVSIHGTWSLSTGRHYQSARMRQSWL